MERSDPIHWTLFIWIGPVPEEGGGDVADLKTMLIKNKAGKTQTPEEHGHNCRAIFHVHCLEPPTRHNKISRLYHAKRTHTCTALYFLLNVLSLLYHKTNNEKLSWQTPLQAKQKNHQHLLWESVTPHFFHSVALGTTTTTLCVVRHPGWANKTKSVSTKKTFTSIHLFKTI